jgi:hypothetical protein
VRAHADKCAAVAPRALHAHLNAAVDRIVQCLDVAVPDTAARRDDHVVLFAALHPLATVPAADSVEASQNGAIAPMSPGQHAHLEVALHKEAPLRVDATPTLLLQPLHGEPRKEPLRYDFGRALPNERGRGSGRNATTTTRAHRW